MTFYCTNNKIYLKYLCRYNNNNYNDNKLYVKINKKSKNNQYKKSLYIIR